MTAGPFVSPGNATDALVQPASAQHLAVPGGVARTCLERPGYWDGNQLILEEPPTPAQLSARLAQWRGLMREEVQRVTLSWEVGGDGGAAETREALAALRVAAGERGLELSCFSVLELGELAPPPTPRISGASVELRPVRDDEWPGVVAIPLEDAEYEGAEAFLAWHYGEYRQAVRAGRGAWWGAFVDGELASTAGVFWAAAGATTRAGRWARYQEVATVERHRRRGLAGALVHAMASALRAADPAAALLIVAEEGSSAERLYRRLGFAPRGQQWKLSGMRDEVRW